MRPSTFLHPPQGGVLFLLFIFFVCWAQALPALRLTARCARLRFDLHRSSEGETRTVARVRVRERIDRVRIRHTAIRIPKVVRTANGTAPRIIDFRMITIAFRIRTVHSGLGGYHIAHPAESYSDDAT